MIAELLSSALGLALYLNTLGADFCYDDSRAIKTNQDLLPETPWTHIFYNDFWGTLLTHSGSHKSYRPLCTLSFRINHAVGGMDPWGYHLVNVLLHAAVTGLFTNFSRILFGDGYWTLVAGLLFAAHPIHTEAVAGIVGRADIGACLFFLLSLMCYMKHCSTRGSSLSTWGWILGAGLCAGCSMLWKEQGVTVLAISAVYDIFVFHRLKMPQIIPALCKETGLRGCGCISAWFVLRAVKVSSAACTAERRGLHQQESLFLGGMAKAIFSTYVYGSPTSYLKTFPFQWHYLKWQDITQPLP